MGVGQVGGCLLSLRVCVCLCMGVCVSLYVCGCGSVRVCVLGGQVQGNVSGCGDFVACIGGVGVANLPVSSKNSTKFVRSSHEIPTKFVGNSCKFRKNFVRNSSPKCLNIETVNLVVTNCVRNSYQLRTTCMNLYLFCAENTNDRESQTTNSTKVLCHMIQQQAPTHPTIHTHP